MNNGKWVYSGDVDIKYGGSFYNLDGWPDYVDVVEVVDLESATGADGLNLIEAHVVFGITEKDKVQSAMACCGLSRKDLARLDPDNRKLMVAQALHSYGYYDPANCFPDWHSKIVVLADEYFGDKGSWDGWIIDKEATGTLHFVYSDNLQEYIEGEWLL